jgi:two-component system, OmpR family, alkaline phosphatase synthesis response regulator PhoP
LVVDDEEAIRMLCRINLELSGFEVLEAEDGSAALEAARTERPDLILLDLMMPAPDGWQVAEELLDQDTTSSIPIIFVTARDTFRDKARAFGIGAVDYVVKPFDPVALSSLVETTLTRVARGEREQIRRERIDELRDEL